MTIEEIREIVQLFTESGVAELEVQRGDNRVRIRRAAVNQEVIVPALPHAPVLAAPLATPLVAPPAAPAAPANSPAAPASAPASPLEKTPSQPLVDERHEIVKSPIVGTFYDAPAPGAPPFVRVGDRVEPGQVLCIIESMKLMNEIEAEVAGTVVAKLVENGKPVEYGQALFAVLPQ
ncbi:MAG TPA: acetyl-CoA carboxylase biotin carboxyl carrier protein [Bryobacteraceae bacterium]|jgi:acetyl-CoA carboxylase biotin carboxyl carrier protein|nr:acetyl-CoA carboxylase biotin carboxyl carrier protein [Bryobacteraceae bacterium]